MKEIPIRNKTGITAYALIDDEDYERVIQYKWNLNEQGYVKTNDGGKRIKLHRFVMNAPKGIEIDHIHNNKLDNRKSELRFANTSQNHANRSKYRSYKGKGTSSQYKGVSLVKSSGRWVARIRVNHKLIRLGYFASEIEAAEVYNEAAKKYFGEFALPNSI